MCSYNSGCVVNHIHLPAARRIPLAVSKTAGLDRVACGSTREEGRHCRDKGDFIIRGFSGILKWPEGKHPYL